MKVLALGRTEVLYETIHLLRQEHEVCGIITAQAAPEYRKNENDFAKLAEELGCPYLCTGSLNGRATELVKQSGADIAVSLNWVSVVGEDFARLIPRGILNAHYADLPSYRGNAVANWAILRGEPSIAFTVHFMTPGELDSGDIVAQQRMVLTDRTTIGDILNRGREVVPKLFAKALRQIEDGTAVPIAQSSLDKPAFRCYPRLPMDSRIDWNWSAREIDALVRASSRPFSGAYSYMLADEEIRKVTIWSSRVVSDSTTDVGVPGHIVRNNPTTGESSIYTGAGLLALQTVQYDDGEEFAPGHVWRSIRMSFGLDMEAELIRLQRRLAELESKS